MLAELPEVAHLGDDACPNVLWLQILRIAFLGLRRLIKENVDLGSTKAGDLDLKIRLNEEFELSLEGDPCPSPRAR